MKYKSIVKPPVSKMIKSAVVTLGPGEEVGEHITDNREELIIVLDGKAHINHNGNEVILNRNQTHYIAQNVKHNVLNKGRKNLTYIYVVSLFDNLKKED